jgi:hypothetical protein
MTVRKMSALPDPICGDISCDPGQKTRKKGPNQPAPSSPKAKVRGSNPLGRATRQGSVPDTAPTVRRLIGRSHLRQNDGRLMTHDESNVERVLMRTLYH